MPQEIAYQPQVAPGGTAAIPMASPADFGAGVGQGIAQLGGALHERDIRAYSIERKLKADQESTDVSARFAAQRLQNDQALEDLKLTAGHGGAGYTGMVTNMLDGQRAALTDGITEDSARQSAQRQFDDYASQTVEAATHYQLGRAINKSATDNADADNAMRNRIATNPASHDQEVTTRAAEIGNLRLLTADQKDAALLGSAQESSLGLIEGMVNHGQPGAALHLIQTGAFDDHLTPEQLDRARNKVEVEQRRAAAVQEHQVTLAKVAAKEANATVTAKLEAGVVLPDSDLAAAQQRATTIGDDSGAFKFGAARIQNGVNLSTQPWKPEQYSSRINDLSALGTGRTDAQDIELKHLQTIAPARSTAFNADPGAWLSLNGHPPPALNLADPNAIAARQQWRASGQQVAGRPIPFLQPQEVTALATQAQQSPKAALDVINMVAPLADVDRQEAARSIRRIMPNDDLAARLVLLNTGDRALAMNGAAARKADRSLIDTFGHDKQGNPNPGTAAMDEFSRNVAPALALLAPADARSVRDVAGNLYANWAHVNGIHTFNAPQYDTFLQSAVGARQQNGVFKGGVGYWNNAPVLLPYGIGQQDFETRLSHMNWADGSPNAPVWRAPGVATRTMTPAEARKYVPFQQPDGRYQFHGPGNTVLHDAGGGIWTVAVDQKGVHR